MLGRLSACVLTAVSAFAIGTIFIANAEGDPGDVVVTVSTEMIGISISDANVNFGGPHAGNVGLHAYDSAASHADPPSITNTGNVTITSLSVSYAGPAGAEATCNDGSGSWTAMPFGALGPNEFWMKALANPHENNRTNAENAASTIDPVTGSGHILRGSSLGVDQSTDLYLIFRTPPSSTAGAAGCSIGLIVTASAG